MAQEQVKIGWWQFMEGMILKHMFLLQEDYHVLTGGVGSIHAEMGQSIGLLALGGGSWPMGVSKHTGT
jgi:hypothetical protein